ncbi:MAG: hypothetical protein JXR91_00325 [Deltaproteobacteria bacterium]|nr:hypothetical protein [Deltaproteobacteria bacterium]
MNCLNKIVHRDKNRRDSNCKKDNYKYINQKINVTFFLIISFVFFSCTSQTGDDFSTSDYIYKGSKNSCRNNENCKTGYCNSDLKICAYKEVSSTSFIGKISVQDSGDNSEQSVQQLFNIETDSVMEPVLFITPFLKTPQIDPGVNARVIFYDYENSLKDKTPIVYVYNSGNKKSDFYLHAGVYKVAIIPEGSDAEQYPPIYFDNVFLTPAGAFTDEDGNDINIVMPHVEDELFTYNYISGSIYYLKNNNEKVSANGMRVRLFDEDGLDAISTYDYTICTQTTGCGRFSLGVKSGFGSAKVLVDNPEQPFLPVYYFDFELKTGSGLELTIPVFESPIKVSGKIISKDSNGNLAPSPPCMVVFQMNEPEIDRTLYYVVNTNSVGEVMSADISKELYLYPGSYTVSAYPKALTGKNGIRYQSTSINIEISKDALSNSFEIELGPAINIIGATLINDSENLSHVSIEAFDINNNFPESRTLNTISSDDGTFNFSMENSVYRVIAMPYEQSNYASVAQIWNVSKSPVLSPSIQLDYPYVVKGRVIPAQVTDDIGGLEIEWYKEYGERAYLVGKSEIDKDGFFNAILPPK